MSNDSPELQHSAHRALDLAQDSHLELAELKREIKLVGEELGYLKTFNLRLLAMLKLHFQLDDQSLAPLMLQVAGTQEKLLEKPGTHVALPCSFCGRPLQLDRENCIYCGKHSA